VAKKTTKVGDFSLAIGTSVNPVGSGGCIDARGENENREKAYYLPFVPSGAVLFGGVALLLENMTRGQKNT